MFNVNATCEKVCIPISTQRVMLGNGKENNSGTDNKTWKCTCF
jgi:DsbC/DsbD-like thiol-disulfide interchange protein